MEISHEHYGFAFNIEHFKSGLCHGPEAMPEFTYKFVENEQELEGAFEVRREVFAVEQGIPENLVYDSHDGGAMHLIVKMGVSVVGTARVRLQESGEAKLERMAVLSHFRRAGIGNKIISFLIEDLRKRKIGKIVLHAQQPAMDFYKGCDFVITSSPFWEAGIEHVKMERRF